MASTFMVKTMAAVDDKPDTGTTTPKFPWFVAAAASRNDTSTISENKNGDDDEYDE